MNNTVNAYVFSGFADIYDQSRPHCPQAFIDTLLGYLGKIPKLVIDIGCGTGLSTLPWIDFAHNIIGVEPNEDMINVARLKSANTTKVSYLQTVAEETGLQDAIADIITCVQSFHWLETQSSLEEFSRLLKPGGIFAALDNDFPPVSYWQVDLAFENLLKAEKMTEESYPQLKDAYLKGNKNNHLQNMMDFDNFRYVREIVFKNKENCNAQRYITLALSQSPLQRIIKAGIKEIDPYLKEFKQTVNDYFRNQTISVDFCYRMRMAIK